MRIGFYQGYKVDWNQTLTLIKTFLIKLFSVLSNRINGKLFLILFNLPRNI